MSERFPGIEWFCDRCDAHLNEQVGFNDNHPTWICSKCGYENCLSENNIFDTEEEYQALKNN